MNNVANQIKVVSATNALILGRGNENNNAGFSYTFDAGKTWKDMNLLDNLDAGELFSSSFFDSKNGYIIGSKGIMYRFEFKK